MPRRYPRQIDRFCRWPLALAFAWLSASNAATLQASLDQHKVYIDASVVLTLLAEDLPSGETPDLSPLLRDFHLLSKVDSSYLRIQQGKLVSINQWVIHLQPRHSGELEVPPLSLGEYHSPALPLSVISTPAPESLAPEAFLEMETFPQEPYVLSEFNLTVRLYHTARLLQGTLEDPQLGDVQIQRLRNNVVKEALRNGQSYQILESHYAIFPEASGVITIPALEFSGRAAYAGDHVPVSQLAGLARPLKVQAPPLEVRVLAQAAEFSAEHWLAARALTLESHWPDLPERPLQAGEPLAVTLLLRAQGLRIYQLPMLPIPSIPGVRVYREVLKAEDQENTDWITAHREEKLTLIPTQNGSIHFPSLQLAWWDTIARQERVALLPGKTLGGVANSSVRTNPLPMQAALLSTLGVGLLLFFAIRRYWLRYSPRRYLCRACERDDPQATLQALKVWGRWLWPESPPRSCGDIAQRLKLGTLLRELDRALYCPSGHTPRWRGEKLWRAVARLRPGQQQQSSLPLLARLYPERHTSPRTPPW